MLADRPARLFQFISPPAYSIAIVASGLRERILPHDLGTGAAVPFAAAGGQRSLAVPLALREHAARDELLDRTQPMSHAMTMDSQLQERTGAGPVPGAGIAPGDDEARRQALRRQRHRMAAATSALVAGIVYAAHLQGALSATAALISATSILLCILVFYALFRSGLNRRFADPSLTLPQMVAATLVVLGTMYASSSGRSIFLLLLLMVFMFGVLRFDTRQLIIQALAILAAYAGLIGLIWFNRPGTVELGVEGLRWLTLAIALFWFAWMGGYIRSLRNQLRRRNDELTAALRATQAGESNLAEAQRIARIGMWMVDPAMRSTTWSAETFRLFELDAATGVPRGARLRALIHPDDLQRYNDLIRPALLEGRAFDSEFRLRFAGGRVRWLHALGRPVVDEDGRIVMVRGTLRDITEQREADEHIRRLAHFDSLTGLPNRSLFTQLLARAITQAQRRRTPLAVLFVDLDGFKQVNDRLGHDAGDALLAAFASRLTAALRRSDAAGRGHQGDGAARLGGDEFVVLIDDFSDRSQLEVVARRIVSIAATPFRLRGAPTGAGADDGIDGGIEVAVGASIGIAIYPEDGDSLDSLMRRADEAMYRAKQAGRNTWRFCTPGAD